MGKIPTWLWAVIGALLFVSAKEVAVSIPLAQRREKYRALFDRASQQYGIPPNLLMRQGEVESSLIPDARSSAGAIGIMQIVPRYHPELGEAGALDPVRAIPYAASLLRQWYDRFGSWTLALAAYNAGPGNVARYGNAVPPFDETRNYVAKILPSVGITESGVRYG